MKVTRFLLSVLLLGVTASVSFAQGAVSISWQTCTSAIDRTPASAPGQKINVSELGQNQLHKAYDVRVTFGQPGGLKDAWRFDTGGCAEGLLVMNEVDAKTCPAFQQTAGLTIKKWTYDPLTGKTIGLLANSYPAVATVNPATRYLLASFNFDQSFGVAGAGDPPNTCGGYDKPLCAHITYATWLDLVGNEIPFAVAGEYVTANDPTNTQNCPGATPAQAKTWGSLKSQYRN
jgi:hypothetical protein